MIQAPTHDLFVSYADADRDWVEGYLLDGLAQAGVRCHAETAFDLGVPLLSEFEEAVRESRRTLLVLSPAYLADDFGPIVELLAHEYGRETATWPVIPLVLRPVELPPRLRMLTGLDATEPQSWPGVLDRLRAALDPSAAAVAAPQPPACPYPGMAPFREADHDRFFAREREVEELIRCLAAENLLVVVGPSGSGKTSLVLAGLVPALRRCGLFPPGGWSVRVLRPGASPMAALAATLDSVPAPLSADAAAPVAEGGAPNRLLVVDQFEEVFTLARAEAGAFFAALQGLAAEPGRYVVLTVRADFYPDLMVPPFWDAIEEHRAEVTPLGEDGLRQAIVRPAEAAGVYVEAALVERLVADAAAEPGALPMVQQTLVLLWERLDRRFLSLAAYEALVLPRRAYGGAGDAREGDERTGLQVAIERHADAVLGDLSAERRAVARRLFLRLVQFGEGRADTRRRQRVADLRVPGDDPNAFEAVLRHLADGRLLTLGGAEGSAERTVDLAHEALIGGWRRLQKWVAERRTAEQTRRHLEAKAVEWARLGRHGGLLDDVELREAEVWLGGPDAAALGASEDLRALVRASATAAAGRERARYLGQAAGGAVGAGFGFGLAFALAYWSSQSERYWSGQPYRGAGELLLVFNSIFPVGTLVGFGIGLGLWRWRTDRLRGALAAALIGAGTGGAAYALFRFLGYNDALTPARWATGALLGAGLGIGAGLTEGRRQRLIGITAGGVVAAALTLGTGRDLGSAGVTLVAGLALGGLTGLGFVATAVTDRSGRPVPAA